MGVPMPLHFYMTPGSCSTGIHILLEELELPFQVTVLNLWATWCPPCRREMPMMTELSAEVPEARFIFANQGESADQISAFLAAENLPLAGMLRDPQEHLMGRLRAVGLPSTLIFDEQDQLVAAHTGEISRSALRSLIETAKE